MSTAYDLRLVSTRTGYALGRILLALVFLFSGATKAWHWERGVVEVQGLGLPEVALPATILLQLGLGTLLALGIRVRLAAGGLAAFTVAATLLAHTGWSIGAAGWLHRATIFFEHLAIVGGLLAIAAAGPRPRR
ncbi:MAG: DoxX family protein [Pseudomonadota bacterium]